jgi:excisionase family DNA binding protein
MLRKAQPARRTCMPTATPPDRLISLRDLAEFLGVSVSTIYNRRYRGEDLPRGYRVGRQVRYRMSDVEAWLDQQADDRHMA